MHILRNLLYLDKEPKDTFKVTFYYENPIKWTMYGEGSGREIRANTYTFFPSIRNILVMQLFLRMNLI